MLHLRTRRREREAEEEWDTEPQRSPNLQPLGDAAVDRAGDHSSAHDKRTPL